MQIILGVLDPGGPKMEDGEGKPTFVKTPKLYLNHKGLWHLKLIGYTMKLVIFDRSIS